MSQQRQGIIGSSEVSGDDVNMELDFLHDRINSLPSLSVGSSITMSVGAGYGSTNTKIRRFANVIQSVGQDIGLIKSDVYGDGFKIKADGVYAVSYSDTRSGGAGSILGLSLNSYELTTDVQSIADSTILHTMYFASGSSSGFVSVTRPFRVGDIIRAHTDGTANITTTLARISITRIA